MAQPVTTSIATWLTVKNGVKAAAFYKAAFNAVETYRLEDPGGGLVVRLNVDGAEFWISGEASSNATENGQTLKSDTIRMILTVANPEQVFQQALSAGAKEIFPVGEEHGWKLGRLEDPFGLHWEIGHQL
jgi:PhnB protein